MPDEKQLEQARHEYAVGRFADAERDFREITKRDPSNEYAQVYLGQALFRRKKYAEAVAPYEKARALEANGTLTNAFAVARPIPLVPPVMSAVFPSSLFIHSAPLLINVVRL